MRADGTSVSRTIIVSIGRASVLAADGCHILVQPDGGEAVSEPAPERRRCAVFCLTDSIAEDPAHRMTGSGADSGTVRLLDR